VWCSPIASSDSTTRYPRRRHDLNKCGRRPDQLYVDGTEIAHAQDATWTTGDAGMGFWRGGACGTQDDYSFTSYSAMPL
jgi:hypothetical protein